MLRDRCLNHGDFPRKRFRLGRKVEVTQKDQSRAYDKAMHEQGQYQALDIPLGVPRKLQWERVHSLITSRLTCRKPRPRTSSTTWTKRSSIVTRSARTTTSDSRGWGISTVFSPSSETG